MIIMYFLFYSVLIMLCIGDRNIRDFLVSVFDFIFHKEKR